LEVAVKEHSKNKYPMRLGTRYDRVPPRHSLTKHEH
jgi:hypothetical protein